MRIIIFGAPGSGKGTQVSLLEKNLNFFRISTSELIRKEFLKKENSNEIFSDLSNGKLIDDNIIFNLIEPYLYKKHLLFDGYPRNLNQMIFLTKRIKINFVVNINLEKETIFKRVKYRMLSDNFKFTYNILDYCNKIRYKDDSTGSYFFRRIDDKYNVIFKRFFDYNYEFSSIINYCLSNNIYILNVDGNQAKDKIYSYISNYITDEAKFYVS